MLSSGHSVFGQTHINIDSIRAEYGELNVLKDYSDPDTKSGHIPLGFVDDGLDHYYAVKDSLSVKTGFNFNIEYAPIWQWDFGGQSENHLSDELNLIFQQNIFDKSDDTKGNLVIWYQYASTISSVTTTEFMSNLDIISPVNGGDTYPNRRNTRFVHIAYEQRFMGNKLRCMIGKLSSRVFLNLNNYGISDRQDYINFMFVNNPVVPFIARQGLGVFVQFDFGSWYASGMFRDATSTSNFIDFESLGDNTWEYAVEFAFTPRSIASLGPGNYRATIHYTDAAATGLQNPAGWTYSFSADQQISSKIGALFRYAYASEDLLAFKQRLSAGVQLLQPFNFANDRFGFGFWWGEHIDTTIGSEAGMEVFYKMQFARFMEISPDLQMVFNPALSETQTAVFIGGLRLRIIL